MTNSDEVKLLPDDDEETYQIGLRDGYDRAVQDIDLLTGGDGEYRYCTNHDPERHCPDAATMKARIVERFTAPPPVATDEVVELRRLVEKWDATSEFSTDNLYLFTEALVGTVRAVLASMPAVVSGGQGECHGLDTPERICFYEQDFYVLSNFSAFNLYWKDMTFHTLEAAYHWEKFQTGTTKAERQAAAAIWCAPSAHEAFKIAQQKKALRRPDWDDVKLDIMRDLLRAKATQHEYVRRKLLASGDRELVENSWRDDYWGWGPNRDGQNMLGKLWMEVRSELRAAQPEIGE